MVVSKIESTVSEDLCHALDYGMIGLGIDDDDDRYLSLVYSPALNGMLFFFFLLLIYWAFTLSARIFPGLVS